jgi:LacI family transcriptional regulator
MTEIADKVGVSKSLVSFALKGKYGVSDETRIKIIVAAMDLDYDFQQLRSGIPTKQKKKILIILNRGCIDDLSYWAYIVKSLEKQINTQNMLMLLLPWNNFSDSNEIIVNILNYNCNGVVLIGSMPVVLIENISKLKIPLVLIDTDYIGVKHNHIRANNYGASYDICRYLIEKNFTHFCFVGSVDYSYSFKERCRGIQDFLIYNHYDKNVRCDSIIAKPENGDPETYSRKELKEYLADNRPEVIICANDFTAVDVYEVLKDLHLAIPDDISIVSFDNTSRCETLTPKLTSVDIPKQIFGEQAISLLMKNIEDAEVPKVIIELETNLIERDSVRLDK